MAANFSLLNSSDYRVLAASDSAFLPSEPPDIRNWFSSYEYESPELNSGANFEVCDSVRGNDCEKDGYDVEENKQEKEGNLVKPHTLGKSDEFVVDESVASKGLVRCKNSIGIGNNNFESQDLDSSDSLLLSSEYNIKNWFLSYKYESPALSTSEEDFGLSQFKEREADRYEHQHVYKGDQGLVWNKNSSVSDDFPLKTVSKEIVGSKISANHDGNSTKNVGKKSIQNAENSTGKPKRKFLLEDTLSSLSPNKNSVTNSGKSPRKSIQRTDSTENSSKSKHNDAITMNRNSLGKTRTNTELTADGFISMKKNKSRVSNDENSLKGPMGVRSESLRNGDKNGYVERKVLSERTNFQHSDVLGVTGKWRCPQKSKPNLGPPLKQLRLEQWVHRV